MQSNRRELNRIEGILNTTYIKPKARLVQRALSKDIHQNGICLLTEERLSEGTTLALNIAFSEPSVRVVRAEGKVVWHSPWRAGSEMDPPKFLTGVQFSRLSKFDQAGLDECLKTIFNIDDKDSVTELLKRHVMSTGESFPTKMTLLKRPPVKIAAVASYLPEQVVTNQDIIESGLKSSDKTIRRALGAVERRTAAGRQSNADMMAEVAKQILRKSSLDVSQIDRIICSSDPQDAVAPNTAVVVQRLLGARCPAFDVQMSCAGWLCGVDLASRCLSTGEQRILVLASSLVGSRLTFNNRMHRAIFGDGASGILLEPSTEGEILSIGLWADGRYHDKIHVPYPWSKIPDSIPKGYENSFFMSSNQEDFFTTMDFNLVPFCEKLWDAAGVNKDDIDCFLLHQPSMPLFEHSVTALNIPREKTINYFPKYGNLVAAEIPVYLDEAIRSGRIQPRDLIFALTYGAGFTMGGMVIQC